MFRGALRAVDISVAFGGLIALDQVSMEVAAGGILGVIGPNGAGKTTLFDCLSGLLPCSGTVELLGRDITRLAPHKRAAAGLGRSYQDAGLFPTLSVADTLLTAAELKADLGPPRQRAGEIVEMLGLQAYAQKLVRELSTGTRRIVDLGCLLAQRPAVILFDEPSSGIAQREAEALGPLLLSIRDRTGAALVVIEHDMPLLLSVAERLLALETGRVVTTGAPAEVVRHPEVVRSYLGDDPAAINRSGRRVRARAR